MSKKCYLNNKKLRNYFISLIEKKDTSHFCNKIISRFLLAVKILPFLWAFSIIITPKTINILAAVNNHSPIVYKSYNLKYLCIIF
jgi:hypothetical protein